MNVLNDKSFFKFFGMSFAFCNFKIMFNHDLSEALKVYCWFPSNCFSCLCCVAKEGFDFVWTIVIGVNFQVILPIKIQCIKNSQQEFTKTVGLACYATNARLLLVAVPS